VKDNPGKTENGSMTNPQNPRLSIRNPIVQPFDGLKGFVCHFKCFRFNIDRNDPTVISFFDLRWR
jgi:hypothetical protein